MYYAYPFNPELLPMWFPTVFILGACIGSFLNVCIWRIPRDETIVHIPSHCPKCNKNIAWYDNIPLISWIILNGKCRHCKEGISFRYFAIELLTAVLFEVIFVKVIVNHQPLIMLLPFFLVIMFLVTISLIDIDHYIIPNETTYFMMIVGIVMSTIFPEIQEFNLKEIFPSIHNISNHFLGLGYSLFGLFISLGAFATFAILGSKLFGKDALGWGDVKYLGAIGACLGWKACFFTVLFGSILGAIGGCILIIYKKRLRKVFIPFGPFLASGTLLWMLYGGKILILYWDFISNIKH